MLGLDIADGCTKFDHCSLSRSRNKVGAHQNLNGSRDLTMPLSTYLPNLNSLSLPTTQIQQAIQNIKNGVVSGSYASLKVTKNSAIR